MTDHMAGRGAFVPGIETRARPAGALVAALLGVLLVIGAAILGGPSGGDAPAVGDRPAVQEWRGNSGSIR